MPHVRCLILELLVCGCSILGGALPVIAQNQAPLNAAKQFQRDNLIAWCIVPFDGKRRGPEERAAMLERLGFKHFAYDYRAEHIPTFDAEIAACKRHGVSFDAWWFPSSLNDEGKLILEVCKRNGIRPQLWVSGGGEPTRNPDEQRRRVEQEAARIRPIAEAAAAQEMKVGLYNHGGWFGEPENQIAIIETLKLANVGIVYNLHHGHDHVDRLDQILRLTLPHLLAVNLNGTARGGDKDGRKILPLGQGELDLKILKTIRDSRYRGPIGILGHTQNDAEEQLLDNLDGLDWLVPQLDGQPPAKQPKPRTPVPNARADASDAGRGAPGFLIDGRAEYRSSPLTVELRATLNNARLHNILVACDTKKSATHWELFTVPKSGTLTAYLPGMKPDHVRSDVNVCDGQPHEIAMHYEPDRIRLHVDGNLVAEQSIERIERESFPGALAVGRTVEGTLGCDGTVHLLRLHQGIKDIGPHIAGKTYEINATKVDDSTVGLWDFTTPAADQVIDHSHFKNVAKRVVAKTVPQSSAPAPSAGPHLVPIDPALKVVLLDRSPTDVYLAVKVDGEGNVFMGGREGVFVFETRPDGTFSPRQELLRFPADSVIMGLEFHGDDLYVVTAHAVYLVPEGRTRRTGLVPQRILWGIPLDKHVGFHCLAWGPDGDLYLTHGDPLLQYGDWSRPDHWGHWTLYCGPEGKPFPYTGQGAILRMKPDGTDVRIVATGLRGPVGLAFDRYGNLFTNDNDHESRADQYAPARLLHVVEGIDFAWPRGWMASKSPDRFDLVEPMCDLGRGVPCDLAYYDGTYLPESVRERLLQCRWDRYAVTAYKPQPRGMSFVATEETVLTGNENCRPVGIAVGRGGRLFVTCVYMTGNMAVPHCVSDLLMVTRADDAPPYEFARQDSPPARITKQSKRHAEDSSPTAALDDARSDDLYRRQLGVGRLMRQSSVEQLGRLASSNDESTRLAAVLAGGRLLTVPDSQFVPPANLPLFYPRESAYFHRLQDFYGSDEKTDLQTLAPTGSFSTAQWWAEGEHNEQQEALFDLLRSALDDSSDRVRLQAAYYLSLLRDPRSEPAVLRTQQGVLVRRLQAAPKTEVERAWVLGPFPVADGNDQQRTLPPDDGTVDLTATYPSASGNIAWQIKSLADGRLPLPEQTAAAIHYLHFVVHSGKRQTGLLEILDHPVARVWQNGISAEPLAVDSADAMRAWLVDLQPGSNTFLIRLSVADEKGAKTGGAFGFRVASRIDVSLPDRLDSALLASRLRDAATSGNSLPVSDQFSAVNWSQAVLQGDAGRGRKLFGTLACAKCHAISADQKAGGGPSLFEARRRFSVPHLVESVLLPSREIAEAFRAQTVVTRDGRPHTGLITAEDERTVELLLPDATRLNLRKQDIEERHASTLSPMPQGLIKTVDELRDVLAYLLSENPSPP